MIDAMSRRRPRRPLPLRLRLTFAFASAIAIVLALTGVLIQVEFAHSIDARVDQELVDRGRTVQALAVRSSSAQRLLELSGETLAQVYGGDGDLVATTRRARGTRLLTPAEVRRAARRPLFTIASRAVDDDGARVRALRVAAGGRVAAIGESRHAREVSLHRLALVLGVLLPGALLLASVVGYQVAGAALRPVERMRARAAAIGAADRHERLPAPGTGDELDRLATTLNDLLDGLHGALDRERRIVGDASHELRTPISILRTRLEVALREEGGAEQLRAALEGALGDSERLSRLADDLLVLARADQDALPLRREPLDVQDLLERAAERHRAAAGDAGRRIEIHVDVAGGAVVSADEDRVGQALDNLVVNAMRYGDGTIELRARRQDGAIGLVVRDSGPGFPDDFLPRAFERFSQADGSHGGAGSGLGLALVDAIARAHGGRATAANRRGGGAESVLVLPAT
jgi:signal transduction histidine kinase